MKNRNITFTTILLALALACFAFLPQALATCHEGCNTLNNDSFLGDAALTTDAGSNNTAVGAFSMFTPTIANATYNTAIGFEALFHETSGSSNTAMGAFALFNNIGGGENT